MSLQMRQARAYAVGDPGLFGFIGKAVGAVSSIIPGGGLIGKVAGGLIGSLDRKPISQAKASVGMVPGGSLANLLRTQQGLQAGSLPGFSGVKVGPIQIGTSRPGVGAPPLQLAPGGSSGGVVPSSGFQTPKTPCQAGYHLNKTRFVSSRYGVVEKGTMCVKNRRRNPLNPRALSRAMSRVKSAQKAVRCLSLFAGPAARASAKARNGGRRPGGKCRGCK